MVLAFKMHNVVLHATFLLDEKWAAGIKRLMKDQFSVPSFAPHVSATPVTMLERP